MSLKSNSTAIAGDRSAAPESGTLAQTRQRPRHAHYETLIIGAGMSGLAAGIRLAHHGRRVCILERHIMPGGLNSFYKMNGRKFDTGLHSVTNFATKDDRLAPLNKLLRHLRIDYDEFALSPQLYSAIKFPDVELRFNNDFELLVNSVRTHFPTQIAGFSRLAERMRAYHNANLPEEPISARTALREYIADPLLEDMLMCPTLYYGGPSAHDMDFRLFVILFKSIFLEGLGRPREGVRQIIAALLKRYKSDGGELCMGAGVRSLKVNDGRVVAVELNNGECVTADTILSSAGAPETERLYSDAQNSPMPETPAGLMTFFESVNVLDRQPCALDIRATMTFYSLNERLHYAPPDDATDVRSGVICCPNNFAYDQPLEEGLIRVSHLANYGRWAALPDDTYRDQKRLWHERSLAAAASVVPDFRANVLASDAFTPRTIERYTGHINGSIYGSPQKRPDGRTRLANLFICGTDQGIPGIIGAMYSGIQITNAHVLLGNR